MKHTRIFIIFILACCIFMPGCHEGTSKNDTQEHQWRTDLPPITSRFEKISDVQSAYWKAGRKGTHHDDRLAIPGPTDYYMHGYFVVGQDEADRLLEKYMWEDASAPALNDLCEDDITNEAESKDIKYNADFELEHKPAMKSNAWRTTLFFSHPQRKVFFHMFTT